MTKGGTMYLCPGLLTFSIWEHVTQRPGWHRYRCCVKGNFEPRHCQKAEAGELPFSADVRGTHCTAPETVDDVIW